MDNTNKRPISGGKSSRYDLAVRKYQLFQNRQDKLTEMDNILTGKHKETIVPKAGEFVVISTDKKVDPSDELSIGLDELLDSARQTIQQRIESGRKSGKAVNKRGLSTQFSQPMIQKSQANLQSEDHMLASISSQPQRRFQFQNIGNFRQSQTYLQQNDGTQSKTLDQTGSDGMGQIGIMDQQQLEFMNSARQTREGFIQKQVMEKQFTMVSNPDMKTSMTTSIRNIMRKQDKELITSSSRLLHSQLEAFEEQMKIRQQILQGAAGENNETLEQLQNKIAAHQQSSTQLPQMLPSLSKSGFGMQSDASQIAHSQSSNAIGLTRPGSAYVLFGGDKDLLKQAKSRFNLKESRQRDIKVPYQHSYKPQPQKYQLEKVRNPSLASHCKTPQLPALVQQQQIMNKEHDLTSPFMREQTVPPMIIREDPPKITHSPEHQEFYRQLEERALNKEKSPMKYSYNIDSLNNLRQQSQSPSKDSAGGGKSFRKSFKKSQEKRKTTMKLLDEQQLKILNKQFLPIDAYDPQIDTEDPVDIIYKYMDMQSGKTFAKSKWFFANGEFELRDCEVLRYLKEDEQYEIKWIINDGVKKVSRFNLIFKLEDEEQFRKRVEEARKHRQYAERIMRYYYLIENTKIANYEMSDEQKTQISYLIHSFDPTSNISGKKFRNPMEFLNREAKDRYNIPSKSIYEKKGIPQSALEDIHKQILIRKYNLTTLSTLFKELDQDYTRSHKQIQFDSQLPYSTEKYNLFKSILPQEKFVPVSERIIKETQRKGLIQIEERSMPFKELLSQMNKKLHQANQQKLESLNRVNENMIKFQPMNFFKLSYKTPHSKEMYLKTNRIQSGEVIREVRNCMFDSQYEIHSMIATEAKKIKDINEQRKKAASYQSKPFKEEQFSEEFISEMSQFQILLNMLYERSIRTCYENSIAKFIDMLKYSVECLSESLSKNILANDCTITEENFLHITQDAILHKRMENKIYLKISLTFNKEKEQIQLDPPVDIWLSDIVKLIYLNVEEISFVPCFSANEIGSAREDSKVHIFEKRDEYIIQKVEEIVYYFQALFTIPSTIKEIIFQYGYLLAIDIKKFKRQYKENDYPIETYKAELEKNESAHKHIEKVMFEDKLKTGFFCIKVRSLKKQFVSRINELNQVMFQCIKKKIDQTNKNIESEVEKILALINKEPIENIEELTEITNFINNLDVKMLDIRNLIQDVMSKMGLLEEYQYKLKEEEFTKTWQSFSMPLEIFRAEFGCRRRMRRDEREFFQDLRIMTEKLFKDFDEVKIEFDILQRSEELNEYEDAAAKSDNLFDKLESALAIAEIVNRREGLFKLKITDFNEIQQTKNAFNPYYQLWNLARDYFYKINTWMSGPIIDFDREKIMREVTDACTNLTRMEKIDFKEKKATAFVCVELKKFYEQFKPFLPLIMALRNPSLKMRHWENIQKLKVPNFDIDMELHTSIQELVDRGIMDFIEDINEISDCASREKKLEDAISRMRDEWKHIKFELSEFRNSGTFVLKGAEPIWDLLDEHIMKTMTIASSPYIKFLQSEVNYWKYTLVKVQEILEEWTKVQRGWLYLWPIFTSEDIQKQMPAISASFQTVDKIWRAIMLNTQQNPNVLDACMQSRVYENFVSCNDLIDRIQKGLNEYLNTKRQAFPRFYFLSNDDLLHILSQTKEPTRVQDHMNKCFEGIDKLEFDDEKKIYGMYSSMGEYIQFVSVIDPIKRENVETQEVRNVEEWLSEVEFQMRDSLRYLVKKSSQDYGDGEKRAEWLFKWPSQIVLTLDQVLWTSSVESGIKYRKKSKDSMKNVFLQEEQKLQELVELIKVPRNNEIHLMTLGALIVLDVHSKDVTKELAMQNVKDIAAFEWISQLRYYILEESSSKVKDASLEINVKMVNSVRLYGFEYLGNQTRLVITPLTDRCYRTLMGALQLNLGGAPEGPAGTGKTETTKDLAKALAKQCIVFNCSDQLDVEAMAKFFKGLACCGAWACFDEFNRIQLEVLSVIAQQILTIQTALMRKRPQAPFLFDDEQIPMNPTCAVFITMNPGYAGRSDLPDNLKALFRPVAMMIPNYAMIAEISLYSFGFQNARELSIKIIQSLRLASEQLSTQNHYDYGMRAVKSIILAAGGLKREFQKEDESKLCLRAISDCNIPKFVVEDIPLFEGIISDLFPTTDKSKPNYEVLQNALMQSMEERGQLSASQEFELKAIQLFETVQVRHGLMMVGSIMSAKTEIVHTLAQALSTINRNAALLNDSYQKADTSLQQNQEEGDHQNKKNNENYEKVKINTINPKSLSIGRLYGDFDKITHDWTDGILATVIKDCAYDKSLNRRWILMDGPVDAVWIENLNTVLDDNKKLCLTSGEIVKFTPKMTMMFEVEDLLEASPATVSRCGMVYTNSDKLGWQVLTQPWLISLPDTMKVEGRFHIYKELIEYFVPKVMGFLFGMETTLEEEKRLESLKTVIPVTKNWQFKGFLSLFESFLLKDDTRLSMKKKEQELRDKEEAKRHIEELQGIQRSQTKKKINETVINENQKTEIFNLFLMALSWSFGAPLYTGGRFLFSDFLQKEVQEIFKNPELLTFGSDLQRRMVLEETGDFFSCFYNIQQGSWQRWDFEIDKINVFEQAVLSEEDSSPSKRGGKQHSQSSSNNELQSIQIPTEDTIRYSFVIKSLISHDFNIIVIGPTGTGKTSAIKKFSNDILQNEEWEKGQMVLSATATALQVQDYLQNKVEKLKKGVYGPKLPGHRLFIFVDDLNMPAKEKYGAQPPIELLRQTIDNGGFYDLSTNEWMKFVDLVFAGAMGLPGGGKTLPSKRLLRHFNLIHIPQFSNENLFRIFSKILDWGFSQYPDIWQKQVKTLTKLTIAVYDKAVQTLLPLPSKSHYLFNLRQVSEIVQGLLMVSAETVQKYTEDRVVFLQRLWLHETMRVFSDRLINTEDKQLFLQSLKEVIQAVGPSNYIDLDKTNADAIIFNNFVSFNPNDPQYTEMQSLEKMKNTLNEIIDFFNQISKEKLSLLLFDYVIQHTSRLSRIIYKPYGNGLLIGLGGNGRKSLAKLAAFINQCSIFKIEITKTYGKAEWQEDLKSLYKSLGSENKKMVFTFADSHIKNEMFIEDISNILNVGEVPNLYTSDEIEEIKYEMQKHGVKKQEEAFDVFIERSKRNLHLLLFMSPAGSQLSLYIRQYPSLVNCTSIDWFLPWPEEALKTVSNHFLTESNLFEIKKPAQIRRPKQQMLSEGEIGNNMENEFEIVEEELSEAEKEYNIAMLELQENVGQIFVQIHNSTLNLTTQYLKEKKRTVYITPTRFIELFKLFESIMKRKHFQIDEERNKYLIGIQKLEEANLMVDQMKIELEDLKPILEKQSKQVEATMIVLDKETKEVESIKEVVDREAQGVALQKAEAEGIKNECLSRLSEAQPLLDEAIRALKTINTKDFVTMKSYNSPPYPIKLALEAACIMLGEKPKLIEKPGAKGSKPIKVPDYWEKSKKLLNDYKSFVNRLEKYDKDNISEDKMHQIQEYLDNPKFIPEEIKKASEAAEGICKWVRAICKYDIVAKEIRPKREALGIAQDKLVVVSQKLAEKEAELAKIIERKNKLEEEFKNQNFEKQNLIMKRDECQSKLQRATILMNSLGNERSRWEKTSEKLLNDKESLLGDVILTTAFINYLSPFEGSYREQILQSKWRNFITDLNIIVGETFSLQETLGQPNLIQQWQLKGIPSDNVSIENMIILTEQKDKWPLLVDPQGQASKFIKELLDQDFIAIKLSGGDFTRKLEPALISGQTVICENIGESIDPVMNSVMFRETYEVGGDKYIKFNDNQVEFNDDFKLFMITSLANPHFNPVIQTRMKVMNFSVTKEGLEQQLLSMVCRSETPRDEDEREKMQRQNVEFKEQKRLIEEQILQQLKNAGQDILEDDSLVNSLNESKKITDDIKQKLNSSRHVEERIEENRKTYKPVAEHGAKLYFAVQELATLDPMYQFSMKWFKELIEKSFTYSETKIKDHKGRVRQLKNDFRKVLFSNVCRSLFEIHKLMFAFSMAVKLNIEGSGDLDNFNKKLQELDNGSVDKQLLPVGAVSKKVLTIEKKSDQQSVSGMGGVGLSKSDEEKLRIPKDELNYLLTGLIQKSKEASNIMEGALNTSSNKTHVKDQSVSNDGGGVDDRHNPVESFIDQRTWLQILDLSTLDHFEMLPEELERNPVQWKKFVLNSNEGIPEPLNTLLPDFAQILLYKVLKPEKTINMIIKYIEKSLGSYFVKPIIYSLNEVFGDSKYYVPIILILTPGNDPMEQIKKFGEEKSKVPFPVSLGKGQGDKAKTLINEVKQYGGWVVLQNCHLAPSFLPELEQLIELLQPAQQLAISKGHSSQAKDQKKEKDKKGGAGGGTQFDERPPHPDFRLWLTSMSSSDFPFAVLQNSIKLTSEPPKGIKSSLIRTYQQIDNSKVEKEFYESNSKPDVFKKLFLGLSFFHGIVRERRKYGALGWNLRYDFNDSDFRISMRQLHLMIDTFDSVPFKALSYLTGECNYGGRVTDDWDRRVLTTILKDFYCNHSLKVDKKYEFAKGLTEYYILQKGEFEDYMEYVTQLPDEEDPGLVGLHSNAIITYSINESSEMIKDLLALQTTSGGAGGNESNSQLLKMANEILYQVREPFKIKEVEKKYPFKYEDSMNSVLLQELARFNVLIDVIKSSLQVMIKTLQGKLVATAEIERMMKSIQTNNIPDLWRARSYPSKKPLLSYVKDLQQRLQMLDDWIRKGQPAVYWISGFYFTQSFLTGIKQNFARKYAYPIDKVSFTYEVLKQETHITSAPQNGCYIQGLYLEGAGWNNKDGLLEESQPKVLYVQMPTMYFLPVLEKEESLDQKDEKEHRQNDNSEDDEEEEEKNEEEGVDKIIEYQCPVYKTSARAGTLSTTGHSTNYILTTVLPSRVSSDIWIKRSVALLSQLDD